MKTQALDTPLEFEKMHIEVIRQASLSQRFALIRSMTRTMLQNGWRAVRRANPTMAEEELLILFIKMAYGDDLSRRFRDFLENR